ncbi:MAG: LysM peptidoglycan-binding domain-containing protein [Candidatus Omnitrophica bacterium]|nr:LysM peptidoglycan-binding domain-containing protein [Candidatus Omnitrophota bacterium]
MDEEEVVVESEDAMGESGDEEFLYKKPSYKESLYEEEDTDYDYGDMTPPKETRIPSAGVSKEAVTPLPSSSEYTVQKGDTLQKISKKFYDSYSKWPKIYEANKSVISDPDKIKPGIVLQIPMQ